jgi:hypothetical protein
MEVIQFQIPIEKLQKEAKSISVTHQYTTAQFPDTSMKGGGIKHALSAHISPTYQQDEVKQEL